MPQKRKRPGAATVIVPATTANLGTGFDSLGIALQLFNRCSLRRLDRREWRWEGAPAGARAMMRRAAAAYFRRARRPRFGFSLKVSGDVPVARGLGSSVTVRLGILAGLNALDGRRLNEDQLLELTAALEGHPDNAAPALVGGFVVSTTGKRDQAVHFVRAPVDSRLRFILLIPNLPIQTRRARQVLPRVYRREDAVHNLGRACLLTAALLRKDYPALWEAVDDRLHQPYRSKLFQPLYPVLKAARKSGAMAGWLSGSGSALCLVTMGGAGRLIGLLRRKIPAVRRWKIHVVRADNRGLRVR